MLGRKLAGFLGCRDEALGQSVTMLERAWARRVLRQSRVRALLIDGSQLAVLFCFGFVSDCFRLEMFREALVVCLSLCVPEQTLDFGLGQCFVRRGRRNRNGTG